MRVAAIYDIHANLPALEAVLQEIRQAEVDQVIVGGDVVPGPLPKETLRCLLDLPVPTQFIYGNGEVAVLEQMAGRDPSAVPEQHRPIIRWTARQLPEIRAAVRRLAQNHSHRDSTLRRRAVLPWDTARRKRNFHWPDG